MKVGILTGGGDAPGDIAGPLDGLVTVSGGRAVLIANNAIPNNENIALEPTWPRDTSTLTIGR